MGTKKKNTKPEITLAEIVNAGPNGMYIPEGIAIEMQETGDIEINLGVKDEAGNVAVRATESGIAKIKGNSISVAVAAPVEPSGFKIESGIEMPAPEGRGRSGSKYPFDVLEVGQSFFVPDTAEQPDATASLASTVSGATQRYASNHPTETKVVNGVTVPVKVYSRKFSLRKVDGGARVWRVA